MEYLADTGSLLFTGRINKITGNYGVWQIIQTDGRLVKYKNLPCYKKVFKKRGNPKKVY